MKMLALRFFILAVILVYQVHSLAKLEEVFAWKSLPLAWPSEDAKNAALKSGDYIPAHTIPLGMEIWRNKLFFTIPRWKSHVPITLGYININDTNKSPSLIPYPSWEANAILKKGEHFKDDNHIHTTFRVAVDKCDRLWVMDMGLINILDDYQELAPPSILIYDLNTDKLIKKYVLDKEVLVPGAFFDASFFPNIVIESNKDRCDDAYAYLPDTAAYGLVVYSLKHDEAWRFKHNFFYFDPLRGNFNSGGFNFRWRDGVFGLALGPEDEHCDRTMYFHPSASWNEFSVNTGVLKNKTLADNPANYYLFKNEGIKGEDTQTTASIFDEKSNTLFLAQLNRDGVACWNPKKPLKPENVPMIAQDHKKLIFANEVRIDNERYLWILSNKMSQFIFGKLDYNEVNYRLFKVKVDDVIAGTACVA